MRTSFHFTNDSPFVIGIAGGSGSGKTYLTDQISLALDHGCSVLAQDHFYHDQSSNFDFDGGSINFDHPSALDFDLFAKCLGELRQGRPTRIPNYDFKTHSRKGPGTLLESAPVILVDGTLIFHHDFVRELMDEMIFLETDEETRFQRRLYRDVRERGRTPEGVHSQFFTQVKPMHDQFVAPSADHATVVLRDPEDLSLTLRTLLPPLSHHVRKVRRTQPQAITPLIQTLRR